MIKPQLVKDILQIVEFEKYEDYASKVEYESIMKKQKQNYFFKQRFKSQRNTSGSSGSYHTSVKLGATKLVRGSGKNHSSLSAAHERLGMKSHPASLP